jgi:2-dehydro-3-deoxyphosphooctonate aldolase (KDO 8-P synthase)
VFKASFDKANRSAATSYRGCGLDEGLKVLAKVRSETGLPVITDVHEPAQVGPVAEVVDMLQTPAFLARQTDLIAAAAASGRPVNIKKAQFMAPGDMAQVIAKARAAAQAAGTDPDNFLACERGTSFGYGNLVVDMRSLVQMRATGCPVVFDATHSVQLPGANGTSSGGQREFVEPLARAAVAVGVAGLFMETHPDPANALSDGPNAIPLDALSQLVDRLGRIAETAAEIDRNTVV